MNTLTPEQILAHWDSGSPWPQGCGLDLPAAYERALTVNKPGPDADRLRTKIREVKVQLSARAEPVGEGGQRRPLDEGVDDDQDEDDVERVVVADIAD